MVHTWSSSIIIDSFVFPVIHWWNTVSSTPSWTLFRPWTVTQDMFRIFCESKQLRIEFFKGGLLDSNYFMSQMSQWDMSQILCKSAGFLTSYIGRACFKLVRFDNDSVILIASKYHLNCFCCKVFLEYLEYFVLKMDNVLWTKFEHEKP